MLSTLDLCFIYFDLEMRVADINFSRSATYPKKPSHLILEVRHTRFSRAWESQQQLQFQIQGCKRLCYVLKHLLGSAPDPGNREAVGKLRERKLPGFLPTSLTFQWFPVIQHWSCSLTLGTSTPCRHFLMRFKIHVCIQALKILWY